MTASHAHHRPSERGATADASLEALRHLHARRPAFTLVELLIVITLIAIAATVAVPMLSDTDGTRLQSAARLLVADLEFAQIESITHADDLCLITLDQATGSYTVSKASAPATAMTNPGTNQSYVTQFGTGRAAELAGVSIQGYSLDGDDVIGFGALGETDQTTTATITLTAGGQTLTVQIDPTTGEASIQ